MNKSLFLLPVLLFCIAFRTGTNLNKKLPNVQLNKLEGGTVSTKEFIKKGKPAIISFWSITCLPCMKELIAINKKYDKWQKETGVTLYAVSIDPKSMAKRVPIIANKKNWKFPILKDEDKSLFSKMGVSSIPYTIIIDGYGKIIYEHNSYKSGDEEELYKVLKSL
jgi:peroxiredoxin